MTVTHQVIVPTTAPAPVIVVQSAPSIVSQVALIVAIVALGIAVVVGVRSWLSGF